MKKLCVNGLVATLKKKNCSRMTSCPLDEIGIQAVCEWQFSNQSTEVLKTIINHHLKRIRFEAYHHVSDLLGFTAFENDQMIITVTHDLFIVFKESISLRDFDVLMMLCLMAIVVFAVFTAVLATEAKMRETGAILSAQFYCDIPCKEKTGLYVSAVNPKDATPSRLLQLLPPAPVELRNFPLHTVFEPSSKLFITFGINYPSKGKMTAWSSIVSGADMDSMKASAIGDEVVFTYPVSSSPSPLNIMPLEVARVVLGPQHTPLVIFTNGEIHSLDMTTGGFTLKHRLISETQALDVSFPAATAAQVYDSASDVLYSVLTAGMFAYLTTTAFTTF